MSSKRRKEMIVTGILSKEYSEELNKNFRMAEIGESMLTKERETLEDDERDFDFDEEK